MRLSIVRISAIYKAYSSQQNRGQKLPNNSAEFAANQYHLRHRPGIAAGIADWQKKRIEHKRQLAQRRWSCGRCGRTWLGHKASLCAECRIIDSQENKRASRARRKAIKRGATSETFGRKITLKRLIERDGIRCAICGRNTDADAHHLSDAYPSVDHIVPSSHGGAHSWTNVRVAHRGCNSRRQNNPSGAIQTALPMIIEIRGAFGTIIMTPVATENRKK